MVPYIGKSLYPHFFVIALEWVYLSVLQNTQGIDGNRVIKGCSVSKYLYIVYHRLELLRTHFHGLYCPDLSIKDKQNRRSRHCIRRGFVIFTFPENKQVISFNEVTSILHLKRLCCICIIPGIFLFLGPVGLIPNARPFFACLLFHHLFDYIYTLFFLS